jgi:hypothetical protein
MLCYMKSKLLNSNGERCESDVGDPKFSLWKVEELSALFFCILEPVKQ